MISYNVKPKKVIPIFDQFMQRDSFYIIADFPDLNLTDCKIDIIIGFGIEKLNNMKIAWENSIGITFPVALKRSGERNFTLVPSTN